MRYFFGTVLLIVGLSAMAFGECSAADTAALVAFDHAWGAASVSGDRAALMNIYADDFVGIPNMQGKMAAVDAAVKAAEKAKMNANPDKVSYDHYMITCTANSAMITHRNTIWTADGEGGKPQTFYTRSVHTLEKRDGKWLVVGNAGNGMDDYAVLWYLEQDWNDANLKHDKEWFEKNYASDYSSVGSTDGKLYNKAEDIADTMNSKSTMDMVETTDMNVRIDGNVAIVTGIYHGKGKNDKGVAFDRKTRFTDTWIKRDGRWQAWATAGAQIKE